MTDVVLALIRREGRWFLQRRDPAGSVLPGRWEFPGGKVEAGESFLDGLGRELLEETGLRVVAATQLPDLEGDKDGPVRLHPFLVEAEGRPQTELAWGWFRTTEMLRLPTPPANGPLLRHLAAGEEPAGT